MGSEVSHSSGGGKTKSVSECLAMFRVDTSKLSSEQQTTIHSFLKNTGQCLINLATKTNPKALSDALTVVYRSNSARSKVISTEILASLEVETEMPPVPSSSGTVELSTQSYGELRALEDRLYAHMYTQFSQLRKHIASIDQPETEEKVVEEESDSDKETQKHVKKIAKAPKLQFFIPTGGHMQIIRDMVVWTQQEGITVPLTPELTKGAYRLVVTPTETNCSQYVTGFGIFQSPRTINPSDIPGEDAQCIMYKSVGSILHAGHNTSTHVPFSDGSTLSLEVDLKKRTMVYFVNDRRIPFFVENIPRQIQFFVRAYDRSSHWQLKSFTRIRPRVRQQFGDQVIRF
ncbi:hypothetical protein BLNAU_4075 [Blattamonas nauphoetae]|uniref:SPRY domain-containing protein n=1 Tax=Blattamonas nauphoetae TaxID=2049346 RepID=A0ABQ9YB37_9EUKA|nr:hypothetical protein BLNAU_4075 [Blattamonas nauphoetae]